MRRRILIITIFAPAVMLFASIVTKAQTTSVFAAGLKAPNKVIFTPAGNLLVAEGGTGANDGRVSLIDRNGARKTLLDGLPSAINLSGGEAAPSGPSGIAIRKKTLYVLISSGDSTLPGPVQGTEAFNPQPSSPLFSSILAFNFQMQIDNSAGNFTLSLADQNTMSTGGTARLSNATGERATGTLLVDFQDFLYEFRPDFPNNVRTSNPFSLTIIKDKLYVADSSLNQLKEVDATTGDTRPIAIFNPFPNPLPFGPPFSDAVPDNVKPIGNQLLVTFLTGFPFAPGTAQVRRINPVNSSQTVVISGLSSAIDVIPFVGQGGQDQYYTLEFSTNMLQNAPGQIRLFSATGTNPVVVAGNLITPTSMARDDQTGAIYVTSIFPGLIVKVQP